MRVAALIGVALLLSGATVGAAELPADMEKVYQKGGSFLATNGEAYTLKEGWFKHHENVAVAPDCEAGTVQWQDERVKVDLLVDEEGLEAPATVATWAFKCKPEWVELGVGLYRQAVATREADGRARGAAVGQAIQNASAAYANGYQQSMNAAAARAERNRTYTTTCSASGPNVVCRTR